MPSKMASVDYERCYQAKCDRGICPRVPACSHKLLKQEEPYEIPMIGPYICLDDCLQEAIIELTLVLRRKLQATFTGLKDRTEEIITRIEKLKEQQ